VFWRDARRPKAGTCGLLSLLFAGMFMAHYRVTVIALSAAAAWSLRALWDQRKSLAEWAARMWRLAAAGLGALALVTPWIPVVMGGKTPVMIKSAMQTEAGPRLTDIGLWTHLGFYIGPVFWIAGAAALAVAIFRNRKLATDLVFWIGIAFLAANPHLLHLPGAGIESNFVLLIMLYVPISWLLGSAVGEAAGRLDRKMIGRVAVAGVLAVSLFFGFGRQARIVDPFFRMVEENDVAAMSWIRKNTPRKARFLTNAMLAFNNTVAIGSDAGWWIPYFTRRWIPFLPMQFGMEKLLPDTKPRAMRSLVVEVRETEGDPEKLARIFLRENLSYVYLGEKRGSAAYAAVELLPESWFRYNPYFIEEARFGAAMIWRFDAKAAASIQLE